MAQRHITNLRTPLTKPVPSRAFSAIASRFVANKTGSTPHETKAASETTGTEAQQDKSKAPGSSSTGDRDDRHPAKQPDPQVQPKRSTGFGKQEDVSPNDPAGEGMKNEKGAR